MKNPSLLYTKSKVGTRGRREARSLDTYKIGAALVRSEDLTLAARFINPKSRRIAYLRALAGES